MWATPAMVQQPLCSLYGWKGSRRLDRQHADLWAYVASGQMGDGQVVRYVSLDPGDEEEILERFRLSELPSRLQRHGLRGGVFGSFRTRRLASDFLVGFSFGLSLWEPKDDYHFTSLMSARHGDWLALVATIERSRAAA